MDVTLTVSVLVSVPPAHQNFQIRCQIWERHIPQKFINVVVQASDLVIIDPHKGIQFPVIVKVTDKN